MKPITLHFNRGASYVNRFHTDRVLHQQTLAEHQYNVVNLLLYLTSGEASKELILAGLHHDLPEILVGDTPAPIKIETPALKAALDAAEVPIKKTHGFNYPLSDDERQLLKFADMVDAVWFALEECTAGNTTMYNVVLRGTMYLKNLVPHSHLRAETLIQMFTTWLEDHSHIANFSAQVNHILNHGDA